MPPELADWLPPAVIVAVMLYLHRAIRQDMVRMEGRLRENMNELRGEVADLRKHVDTQIGELRERMAHLEGLLEGLREAITRRNVA